MKRRVKADCIRNRAMGIKVHSLDSFPLHSDHGLAPDVHRDCMDS